MNISKMRKPTIRKQGIVRKKSETEITIRNKNYAQKIVLAFHP